MMGKLERSTQPGEDLAAFLVRWFQESEQRTWSRFEIVSRIKTLQRRYAEEKAQEGTTL